jgi:hypothetical protein
LIERQSDELTKLHEKVRDQTIALDVAEHAKQHVRLGVEVTPITADLQQLRDSLEESKSSSSGHSRELESRLRESDRLRQLEVSQCAAQVDRLQIRPHHLRDELAETCSKLREQDKHAEERLTGEERSRAQQLQFIQQLPANLTCSHRTRRGRRVRIWPFVVRSKRSIA